MQSCLFLPFRKLDQLSVKNKIQLFGCYCQNNLEFQRLGGMILYFVNNYFPVSAGDESQTLEIDDVILHPKYDLSKAYQDIAVIKLKPNKGKLLIFFFWAL